MSIPQNQNQPAQKNPSVNQGVDDGKNAETSKVSNPIRKDESAAKGNMTNEGGNCSTSSDNKPKQGGCN